MSHMYVCLYTYVSRHVCMNLFALVYFSLRRGYIKMIHKFKCKFVTVQHLCNVAEVVACNLEFYIYIHQQR